MIVDESARSKRELRIFLGVKEWAAFYRCNPQRFAEDYLGVHLKLFQKIILFTMNVCYFFCYIAARGQGKTWLLAVFCCVRCILYPGTKVCIASGTRSQSLNVLEKVKNDLIPLSPMLNNEIEKILIGSTNSCIDFKNGSVVKVVTASDSARGNRANILLVDEFRMVKKDTIDAVLKKFLTAPRMPGYIHNPKYKNLKERNKEIYLSSAFFKSHWSYDKVRDFANNMLDDTKKYFVCGLPYQLSIKEGLLEKEQVENEMSEAGFNETKFSMESECLWFGDADGSFFDFNSIAPNRKIQFPMLPDEISSKLPGVKQIRIPPKQPGEKRILSADLAVMASGKKRTNDASAIFINQLLPTKSGRYVSNIVYTTSSEGEHTADQALHVRRLFDEYQCDYIVIDVKGVGFGIADLLLRDIPDPDTGDIFPGLSCCNNQDWADRAQKGAQKALWVVNATDKFNSDAAFLLRDGFRSGKIRLLMTEYDADVSLASLKGYAAMDIEEKILFQMPYINTTMLINELINLNYEAGGSLLKISEKGHNRKDRYSSLSYNYYVACRLEEKLKPEGAHSIQAAQPEFMFRAPKIK